MVKELFVYGTLMQQTESPMARFLRDRAVVLGMAFLPGRLYDLGSYPGAVFDPLEKKMITGQIYRIETPEEVFPVLDHYEGVIPSQEIPNEYFRALVPARFNEQELPCWIYLYNLATCHLPVIPGGNYLEYYAQQSSHRKFISGGR